MKFSLRIFSLFLLSTTSSVYAQYTWDGGASNTDFQDAANWSPDHVPVMGDQLTIGMDVNITNVPTLSLGGLTISSGVTVSLDAGSPQTLTIEDGTTTDLVVDGTLNLSNKISVVINTDASGSITGLLDAGSGLFTVNTDATVVVSGIASAIDDHISVNGTYEFARTTGGVVLPKIVWGPTSLFSISGTPTDIISGLNQSFTNVLWNSSTQTADFALDAFGTISGELRVQNAGGQRVIIASVPGARAMTKLSVANGTTVVVSTAPNTFDLSLTDVSLGSGTLIVSDATSGTATLSATKVNSSSVAGSLVIARNTGAAKLSLAGNGSVFTANITSPGAGTGSIVYNGTTEQTVSFNGSIANNIHIANSNTTGITMANYPAGCPLDLYNDAGYTKISGIAAIGDITNDDSDGINATIEFTGISIQLPTFGNIVSSKFTIKNSNNNLVLSTFPSGCNLDNASGKTAKISSDATISALTGAGTVEFNGSTTQAVDIAAALSSGITLKVNNAAGVDFTPTAITVPANATLMLTNGTVTGINGYAPSASLIYNGNTAYVAGNEIATGLQNIYLQNSVGVDLGTSAILGSISSLTMSNGNNVCGQPLTLTSATFTGGKLDMSTNAFTVASGGTFSASNGYLYNGTLVQTIPAGAATYEFPVGTSTGDHSIQIVFNSLTTGGTLTCAFVNAAPGTGGLPKTVGGVQLTAMATGYWSVVAGGGLAGPNYDIIVNATGIAGLSDYTSARLMKRDNSSSSWTTSGTYEPSSFTDFGMTGRVSFSEFGIGVAAGAFPVELASFNATENGTSNLLDWTTASEQNSAYFEVERSNNGNNGWVAIGRVEAAGNSNSAQYYTFTDLVPMAISYYRLRMVDADGSLELSETRTVSNNISTDRVVVGPVPVANTLNVTISSPKTSAATIRVFTVEGRELYNTQVDLNGSSQVTAIDMSQLPTGTYRVTISGAISYNQMVVKQ